MGRVSDADALYNRLRRHARNGTLVPQIFLLARPWERLADAPDGFRYWNLVSWIGGYISAASTLVFILNMVLSLLRRRPAD